MLISSKKFLIFDTETTGLKPESDQIIELSYREGLTSDAKGETWRIKPEVPISPESQKVHGISMEDLKDCASFSAYASSFREIIQRAEVIVGYNISFDLQMVEWEYRRLEQIPPEITQKMIVDPFRLWQNSEPRKLEDAYRRFVGKEMQNMHAAEADVAATGDVLLGMLKEFQLGDKEWHEIADLCEPDRKLWIGPSKHIQWQDGKPILGFGKYQGKSLIRIASSDSEGYLNWIINKNFPNHVKKIVTEALRKDEDLFLQWLNEEFGESKPSC